MAFRPILRASAAGCSAGHLQRSIPRLSAPSYTSVINDASRRPSLFSGFSLLRSHAAASPSRLRLYSTEKTVEETEEETVEETEKTVETEEKTVEETEEETLSKESLQEELEKAEKTENTEETEKIASDSEAPWYLQEEPPRHPALVSEAPPLPTVPKGVPAIMHDLVKYVAEDMGLDELNLLDLRTLDPPAALGPSLIMLFGTARSERHLHVSAGNLKSWLRKHGIQAHADGLLGPNEFKIKMRRKQRKAKLLGTSAMPLGGDDGITTRWICMNLGTIRSDSQASIEYETDTGFGIRQTGTTIVVQMFTESKRKELDLETLWSRILARRGVENLIEDDLEYAQGDAHPDEVSLFVEGGSPKVLAAPSQRRFFSTSLRRSNQPRAFLETRMAELEQLKAHFAGLSPEDALEALEYSDKGRHPPFIKLWNKEIQYLPTDRAWPFRLWMCVVGRKLGVRRFDWAHLRNLVREMELLGIICHRGHYTEMLQSVYLEPSYSEVSLKEQSDLALQILNVMYERGEPIITTDVIVSLIESLARTKSQEKEAGELQIVLEKFLLQADLPYMGEDAVMRLMDAYAVQDNWDRFWEIWRMPPKFMERRTEDMYTHLWTIMAETNNQRLCQDALRWCFHEMLSESPRVNPIMEVKAAIESCLRVADPDAEEIARELFVRDGSTFRASLQDFVQVWRALNPQWPL
ncbi:ATPase synthesis protein 25, mitochondrial [Cytospora mali]|uniref:ATPase synthesis protein 25 n=1 Tax=Cytospora mali TaxID=578113 RepID=A0A194VX89_CYTMA|nr:ATPase synthesis protein 25, mitochondrial [Valsa mali]